MPFRVFTEQLQRIADQLSMAIEGLIAAVAAKVWIHVYVTRRTGVIHGDQYEILDQFSKVSFFFARRNAFSVTRMQAWDRFLVVYKDVIFFLKTNLVLEPLPGQATTGKDPKCVYRYCNIYRLIFYSPGTPILKPTFASSASKCLRTQSVPSTRRRCEALGP